MATPRCREWPPQGPSPGWAAREAAGKRQEASGAFGTAGQTPAHSGPRRSELSRHRAAGHRAPLSVSHSHRLSPHEQHLSLPGTASTAEAWGSPKDLTRTTGRRSSRAVGRGSSSPPAPEVGPGGAVGQWRHFRRVAASRRRPCLSAVAEGRLAGPPGDDRRLAAPRLPGGGAGGGRLLSEGGKLGSQPRGGWVTYTVGCVPGAAASCGQFRAGGPLSVAHGLFSPGGASWAQSHGIPRGWGAALGGDEAQRRDGDMALTERGCKGLPGPDSGEGICLELAGRCAGTLAGPPLRLSWASPWRTGALVTSQNESNCTYRPSFCCLYLSFSPLLSSPFATLCVSSRAL